jgi:hypothetical protein
MTRTKKKRKKKRIVITKRHLARSVAACLAVLLFLLLAQPLTVAEKQKREKPYALIFGTAFGPDDHPIYGVKITIHPKDKKHPSWAFISDHRGEFAARVPPGPGDYIVHGEAEYAPVGADGKPEKSKARKLKGEKSVHVDSEERLDISLRLEEQPK